MSPKGAWSILAAVVLAAGAAAPLAEAAPQRAAPAPQQAAAVTRLQALLAYEPAWYDAGTRLVFFGNRRHGDAVHVYAWEAASGELGRLTDRPARRHSLAVADGRVAFVERSSEPVAVEATGNPAYEAATMTQPGPEVVMVQKPGTREFEPAFKGWVLPDTLKWSPDGQRLALVTMDRTGGHRLGLLMPGQPLTLVQLDQGYEVHSLVGWRGAHDVLLRVTPLAGGPSRLLLVGKSGIHPIADGQGAKLSPNGQWLLQQASEAGGIYMRALSGAGRPLHPSASAFAWGPGSDRVYAAVGKDVVALDPIGKELRRWRHVAGLAVGQVLISPDGSRLALSQDFRLAVIKLR